MGIKINDQIYDSDDFKFGLKSILLKSIENIETESLVFGAKITFAPNNDNAIQLIVYIDVFDAEVEKEDRRPFANLEIEYTIEVPFEFAKLKKPAKKKVHNESWRIIYPEVREKVKYLFAQLNIPDAIIPSQIFKS